MEYLFIGGRRDGRTIAIPDDQHVVTFPSMEPLLVRAIEEECPPTPPLLKVETYHRMQFRGRRYVFEMFVVDGMSADDVMSALMENYVRKRGLRFV